MAKLLALIVPAIETNKINAAVTKSSTTAVAARTVSTWLDWAVGLNRLIDVISVQRAPSDQNAVIAKRFGVGLAPGRIKRFFSYPETRIDSNRRCLPRRRTSGEMLQATPAKSLHHFASAPTLSSRDGIQPFRQIGRHVEDKFHGGKATLGLRQDC